MKLILTTLLLLGSGTLFAFGGQSKLNVGTSTAGAQRDDPAPEVVGGNSTQTVGGPTLLLSYESMLSENRSYFIGGEFELNSNSNYFYTGAGLNFFLGGNPFSKPEDNHVFAYYGFHIGLSSIKIYEFSNGYSAVSTGIEPGVHVGGSSQILENLLVSFQLGYSYHYGISTIASNVQFFKTGLLISRRF